MVIIRRFGWSQVISVMHNVIQHFEQQRIDPIPMCPEKLCCIAPLRISRIDPTLIHPIDPGRSESDRSYPDRSDPDQSDLDRSDHD